MISKFHFETVGLLRANQKGLQKSLSTALPMDRSQLALCELHYGFSRSGVGRGVYQSSVSSLSLPTYHLSTIHPFIHLSTYHLFVYLPNIYLPMHHLSNLSIHLSNYYLSTSIYQSIHHPSIHPPPPTCLSTYLASTHLFRAPLYTSGVKPGLLTPDL